MKLRSSNLATGSSMAGFNTGEKFPLKGVQCHDPRATCHIAGPAGCCHLGNSMSFHPITTCHIVGCCHLANVIEFARWQHLENSMTCHPRATCHIARCCHLANSMSWSQSHMPHCRVLPYGEFNVMISEPRATLLCGRIPSAVLNISAPYFIFGLPNAIWASIGDRRLSYRLRCTC